jgi:protein-S-isoprenylcysteine O-methyltransferase Ste14
MEQLAYLGIGLAGMVIFLLAVKAAFIALAVWYELAFPDFMKRVTETYQTRKRTAILTGAVNVFLLLLIIAIMLNRDPLVIFGFLLAAAFIALSAAAYMPAYRILGHRLSKSAQDQPEWHVLIKGGVLAEAAFLLPLFGQLLSCYTLLRGTGAVILTAIATRRD